MGKLIAKKIREYTCIIIQELPKGYLCISPTSKDYLLDPVFYCPKDKGEDIYEGKDEKATTDKKG